MSDHDRPLRAVSIGSASRWRNPFLEPPSRGSLVALEEFDRWLAHSHDLDARWIRGNIGRLIRQDLVCDCGRPTQCHGQVLLRMARHAARTLPEPAGWVRVVLPTPLADRPFGIAISGYACQDVVVDAAETARWMIGRPYQEITAWIHSRGGVVMTPEQISARLKTLGGRGRAA